MKIYTEVNYEWKNDKLVELSSDSYEYEGAVEEAKGGSFAAAVSNVSRTVKKKVLTPAQKAAKKAPVKKFTARLKNMKISFGVRN